MNFAAITIITATLNRREMLKRAIESVVSQGLDGIEHIVIDGVSTDGTLEMLKRFPHLKVISEPDENLYDAWNKGLAKANGGFICILNSDDELPPGSLDEIRRLALESPEADMICGPVEIEQSGPDNIPARRVIDDPRLVALRERDIYCGVPLTNGRMINRRFQQRIGKFDTRYPVVSDRQFLLRALVEKADIVTTGTVLYRYHAHSDSLTFNDRPPSRKHMREMLKAALDGLAESDSKAVRAKWRRWHAWAAFYLSGLQWRDGGASHAFAVVLAGFKTDALWPLRLPPLLISHWRERDARRGHKAK
jgi:glycosyltransferase involved in cell wall biosynthesis